MNIVVLGVVATAIHASLQRIRFSRVARTLDTPNTVFSHYL